MHFYRSLSAHYESCEVVNCDSFESFEKWIVLYIQCQLSTVYDQIVLIMWPMMTIFLLNFDKNLDQDCIG